MKRSCSAVISDHLCLHWYWPRSGPLSCLSFVLSLSTLTFYFCHLVCISAVICWTHYASPRLCSPFLIRTLLFIFSLFFCSLQTVVSEHQRPCNLTQTAFYTHAQQVLKVMENWLNNPNKSTWEPPKTVVYVVHAVGKQWHCHVHSTTVVYLFFGIRESEHVVVVVSAQSLLEQQIPSFLLPSYKNIKKVLKSQMLFA